MELCNNKPLVSIVIPVYNREDLIRDSIDSALSQTYENIEVVVVDNCSTDSTWNIISSYNEPKLRAFQNSNNIGPVSNWKKGIDLSRGEYIKLLFSDDLISNDYIEESLKCFDRDTAFVVSSIRKLCDGFISEGSYFPKTTYSKDEYLTICCMQYSEVFPVSPGASLFRRVDIQDAFVYNIPTMGELEPMKNGAGIDLLIYLNIANKYNKINIAENTYAVFRSHKGSFSVANQNILHFYFRAMIFFLERLDNKKYLYMFKTYLLRKSTYKEEYGMIYATPIYRLSLLYLLPYMYIRRFNYRLHRFLK